MGYPALQFAQIHPARCNERLPRMQRGHRSIAAKSAESATVPSPRVMCPEMLTVGRAVVNTLALTTAATAQEA